MDELRPDARILVDVVKTQMPYGKYKGTLICDLPVYYLEWLSGRGMPAGKLLLATAFEIKTNGLTDILNKVKQSSK